MKDFFACRRADAALLERFGFEKRGGKYRIAVSLLGGQFLLEVEVGDGVKTSLTDALTGEPYVLHLVEGAAGAFVGSVREAYENALQTIAERCFIRELFAGAQANALAKHIRELYGDEAEFLWERYPDCAVFRRKDTRKWYCAVLTAEREKIGLASKEKAELLDVRMDPREIDLLADGKTYFRGYHMNKRHWLTVVLDGSLPDGRIFELVQKSYLLATK